MADSYFWSASLPSTKRELLQADHFSVHYHHYSVKAKFPVKIILKLFSDTVKLYFQTRSQKSRTNLHCSVAIISLSSQLWQLYFQELSYLYYIRMIKFSFQPRFCLILFQKWFESVTILASWKRNSGLLNQLIIYAKLFFLYAKASNYSWNMGLFSNISLHTVVWFSLQIFSCEL